MLRRDCTVNFEEILPLLRAGKKARMKRDIESGVHYICGYTQILLDDEVNKSLVIVRLEKDGYYLPNRRSWGIEVWAVMADDWEVLE